jgi:hypothetical protein
MVGRRPFAAAVAVVVTAALAPAVEAAEVTIVPARGGAQVTLTEEQLEAAKDVQGRSYTVNGQRYPLSGVSVPALIEAADVDPVFSFAEIARPSGTPLRLSDAQVESDDAFPDGPPIVYWNEQGTYFLRPGGSDGSGAEVVDLAGGVAINLRSGPLLEVEIEATKTRIKPGEQVTFEANVKRAGDGQQLDYSWTVSGGINKAGSDRFTHLFEEPGEYDVTLGVTAPGDDTGGDAVVRIRVGKSSKKGPDRKGGGDNEAADAPDGGASGGVSGAGSASGAESGSAPDAAAAPEPAPAAPEPSTPKRDGRKAEPVTPIGAAAVVSGELLSSVSGSPRSPLGQALRSALRSGSASPKATEGLSVPTVAVGLATTLALLGLGAALELRHARPRRPS